MAIILIVVTAAALTCILLTAVPSLRGGPAGDSRRVERAPVATARPHPVPPPRPALPTSLEGALVRQLIAGVITRAQYRRAMAFIALHDDYRDLLGAPPDE